jgi:hypothetical protein
MKIFENVVLDTNTSSEKKSILENCECEPDCCSGPETADESCCNNDDSNSCCDADSDCSCGETSKVNAEIKDGTATIDGKKVKFTKSDTNLVELAKKANINIPAPYYFAKRKNGCCNACVVEVDGKQQFACATAPQNGMNIIVSRPDLKELRRERILKYKKGIKSGNPISCSVK